MLQDVMDQAVEKPDKTYKECACAMEPIRSSILSILIAEMSVRSILYAAAALAISGVSAQTGPGDIQAIIHFFNGKITFVS
jgi:hypothetical protein